MLKVLNITPALEIPKLHGKYLCPIKLKAELGLAAVKVWECYVSHCSEPDSAFAAKLCGRAFSYCSGSRFCG